MKFTYERAYSLKRTAIGSRRARGGYPGTASHPLSWMENDESVGMYIRVCSALSLSQARAGWSNRPCMMAADRHSGSGLLRGAQVGLVSFCPTAALPLYRPAAAQTRETYSLPPCRLWSVEGLASGEAQVGLRVRDSSSTRRGYLPTVHCLVHSTPLLLLIACKAAVDRHWEREDHLIIDSIPPGGTHTLSSIGSSADHTVEARFCHI